MNSPDDGWWDLDDPDQAEIDAAIIARINRLSEPLAYKSRHKKVRLSQTYLQAIKAPPARRSIAKQTSWHYERGRKEAMIPQEGGWKLPHRDAELKERPE